MHKIIHVIISLSFKEFTVKNCSVILLGPFSCKNEKILHCRIRKLRVRVAM